MENNVRKIRIRKTKLQQPLSQKKQRRNQFLNDKRKIRKKLQNKKPNCTNKRDKMQDVSSKHHTINTTKLQTQHKHKNKNCVKTKEK